MKIGIDFGSRKTKFALSDGKNLLRISEYDTVALYKRFGSIKEEELTIDLESTGMFSRPELAGATVTVTGYGRNTLNLSGALIISEIKAHVRGAIYQTGLGEFTLLDMGGQDTKVALVREGKIADFIMNDKCAASSGRYLENMASILEVSLEELSTHWRDPVRLDATCGIFGESELIGQILRGRSHERLCAGINHTLVRRVLPMLRRFSSPVIILTGGVALNPALRHLLRLEVSSEILIPQYPQHNGAIGCVME